MCVRERERGGGRDVRMGQIVRETNSERDRENAYIKETERKRERR